MSTTNVTPTSEGRSQTPLGAFSAFLESQLALLEHKNEVFEGRLRDLAERFGEVARLSQNLASVKALDIRFAERVRRTPWPEHSMAITAELSAMSSGLGSALSWDGIGCELFRSNDAKAGPRFRRPTPLVRLGALADQLLWGHEPVCAGYAIVFTHDAEQNHRAVVASVLGALVIDALAALPGAAPLEVSWFSEAKAPLGMLTLARPAYGNLPNLPGAEAFGFRPDRELERAMEAYAEENPQARWQAFVQAREPGIREWRDFAHPAGQTVRLEWDARAGTVVRRERAAPIFTRKRANRFVDRSPVQVHTERLPEGPRGDATWLEQVCGVFLEGFVEVWSEVVGEDGRRQTRGAGPLDWKDTAQD